MNRRGVTLIELLVAVLILGIAIAGLIALLAFGFNTTRHSQDTAAAYNIARQEIERAKNIGFLMLPKKALLWNGGYDYIGGMWQRSTSSTSHFSVKTETDPYVADAATITTTSLRTVRVQVWTSTKEGHELLFETETHLTNGGI